MKRYEVEKQKDGITTYFFIRDMETLDIVLLPTKYLMHKIRARHSPNTVQGIPTIQWLKNSFVQSVYSDRLGWCKKDDSLQKL